MKNYEVISSTINEKDGKVSYSAILSVPNATVKDVSVIVNDNSETLAYPPQERYETTDANGEKVVKYSKVVVFKDAKAMNEAADALLKNPTDDIYLLPTPKDIKGGKRVGVATLVGDVTLRVTVLVNEDKKSLVLPGRQYEAEGQKRKALFVKLFDSNDDAAKADREALVEEIIANAKPYEKKEA